MNAVSELVTLLKRRPPQVGEVFDSSVSFQGTDLRQPLAGSIGKVEGTLKRNLGNDLVYEPDDRREDGADGLRDDAWFLPLPFADRADLRVLVFTQTIVIVGALRSH